MWSIQHVRRNAVAYVALFIAMGGTSYAAASLPKGSVGTKQVKKNAITGAKIKKNAITGAKIKKNAVTSIKVKDGSLLLRDFAPNQLAALTKTVAGGTASGGGRGESGATGSSGVTGAPGTPGNSGAKGDAGASGTAGTPGAKGETGATGATGAPGAPGADGVDGENGATNVRIRTDTTGGDTLIVQCDAGERALGGGYTGASGVSINASMPVDGTGASSEGSIPTGWKVTRAAGPTTGYVVCVSP